MVLKLFAAVLLLLLGSYAAITLASKSPVETLMENGGYTEDEALSLLEAQKELIKNGGHSLDRFLVPLDRNLSMDRNGTLEGENEELFHISKTVPTDECQYSWCAGYLESAQHTCSQMGQGLRYSGTYTVEGCSFGTAKVECCTFAGRKTEPGNIWRSTECQWSYCAGSTVPGQRTCDDYKKTYAGVYTSVGCGWFKAKVECCKVAKYRSSDCKRTFTCYATVYSPSAACHADYGDEYQAVIDVEGERQVCNNPYLFSYKCCK